MFIVSCQKSTDQKSVCRTVVRSDVMLLDVIVSQASPPPVSHLCLYGIGRGREGGPQLQKNEKCCSAKGARVCAHFAAGNVPKTIVQCRICPRARFGRHSLVVPGVPLQECCVSCASCAKFRSAVCQLCQQCQLLKCRMSAVPVAPTEVLVSLPEDDAAKDQDRQ